MDTGKVFVNTINEEQSLLTDESFNNISESVIDNFGMSKNDLFYYIYAILHSPTYKSEYKNDLLKEVPRIPIVKNREEYISIGYKLADLHLNYEKVEPYPLLNIEIINANPSYLVKKMRFPKRNEKDTIIYNSDIRISNVPEKAYEYVVNGRSAIEWIMDQYQVKTDRKSGITDDPNLYSDDEKYIFNLLLSIINVSVQTVDLVNSLPPLEIIED